MRANRNLTPVWIVYSDERRLDVGHEGALRSITVDDCLNGIATFTLIFDTAEVKVRDAGLISHGSKLSIHLGYKDDVQEVFCGEVMFFRGRFSENGVEQVEVRGSNLLYMLHNASRFRSFEGKSPSDVIRGILQAYSLKAEVEDFGVAREFQVEENTSDYEYLMKQSRTYGKQVYADGATVYVKNEVSVRTDEVIYEWGKTLVSFDVTENTSGLITGVDYTGWDKHNEEFFTGKAELSDLPVKIGGLKYWNETAKGGADDFVDSRVNLGGKDIEEAKQLALGMLQNNSYRFMRARGEGEGNYKLRPGVRVTVKMVGETYEGEYMAETVSHRFDYRSGYRVEFNLKRNMHS